MADNDPSRTGEAADTVVVENPSVIWYYLGILRRRIWVILPLVLIVATIGTIQTFKAPRIFRATARLLVERNVPAVMQFERAMQQDLGWDPDYYTTQSELVKSRAVMEVALESPDIARMFDVSRPVVENAQARGSLLSEIRRSILAVLGAAPAPPPEPWELLRS